MILIITEFSDIPSQRAISILQDRNIDFKVIYIDKKEIDITIDFLENDICIDGMNINIFSSVWFRRCHFHSYVFLNKDIAYMDKNLVEYLSCEKQKTFEYILGEISRKTSKSIGNPFFSDINKLTILEIAIDSGFEIPPTYITTKKAFLLEKSNFQLISKPVSEVFSLVTKNEIYSTCTTVVDMKELDDNFYYSLFQKNISKKFESKVVYFRGKTYAIAFFSQSNPKTLTDSRNYTFNDEIKIAPYILPEDVIAKLISLFSNLKLNFGIVDFIITEENKFIFLELNPVGQFDDIVEFGNYDLYSEIVSYLNNE